MVFLEVAQITEIAGEVVIERSGVRAGEGTDYLIWRTPRANVGDAEAYRSTGRSAHGAYRSTQVIGSSGTGKPGSASTASIT